MSSTTRGVAVISGAGSGLGREIALALARRGHALALLGRRREPLERTLSDAGRAGDLALVCDVRDPEAVRAAAAEAGSRCGAAEVVVPAAGIAHLGAVSDLDAAEFADVVATNLGGAYHLVSAFLPPMLAARAGSIVILLSVAARRGFPGWGAYCASKAGLRGFAAALREELRGSGLRLTEIYPGATATPLWDALPGDWDRAGMLGAGEVARAVLYALDADPSAAVEEIHVGPVGGAL